jgi:uncharacterized protein YqjF (DUF2071 family)
MAESSSNNIDRLFIRQRPSGSPLMYQSWNNLLFMHWQVPEAALRPLLPDRLSIDTFEGKAWVAITPFTVRDARPIFTPPLPWVSDFHEINVRTYVHLGGVPGVWFFSLDANSLVAVLGARTFFHLPYHVAKITLRQEARTIHYHSTREDQSAKFKADWEVGELIGQATTESLEFFLVERYCLYTADGATLYRGRIHHQPWRLRSAQLSALQSTMIEVQGLSEPTEKPLLHYSESLDVAIWGVEEV